MIEAMDKDKRFLNFILLAMALVLLNSYIFNWLEGPKPKPEAAKQAEAKLDAAEKPAEGAAQGENAADATAPAAADAPPTGAAAPPATAPTEAPAKVEDAGAPSDQPPQPTRLLTLGSVGPDDKYGLLVTVSSTGAAVQRIEVAHDYFNTEIRSGYLGQLELQDTDGTGAQVRVVGTGTPAALAGVQAGDVITAIGATKVSGARGVEVALAETRPNQTVALTVRRGDAELQVSAKLTRYPMEVVKPEAGPADLLPYRSLELMLEQVDDRKRPVATAEAGTPPPIDVAELPDVQLRHVNWEVVASDPKHVAFRRALPALGVEIIKHFRLEQIGQGDGPAPGYDLTLEVELRNTGESAHKVAYSLDGPTGLPIEGAWYATKVGKPYAASKGIGDHFSAIGLRDVVVGLREGRFTKYGIVRTLDIANGNLDPPWSGTPLEFLGVDAQYFAAVLFPLRAGDAADWIQSSQPIRTGSLPVDPKKKNLTDVSVRVTSNPIELAAGGSAAHRYRLFAGPKQPSVLADYGIERLVYYGWYQAVSVVLVKVLHFFHDYVVFNSGLAIILLTVMVRSALFPLSRRQALNMQKMQTLQPEIKRLQERFKNQPEQLMKAQRELFARAKYNPFSGCLPMLIQIPIFLGLYRALAVNVELRDAPLISHAVYWASNLAAPDKLYDWSSWMPAMVQGFLGPYLNVLPIVTIGLFLWQQKMFMPPATDEQTRMQQQVMKYMMVFMGLMFFKVPSGLCLYFIASSTWGILERKLLPKVTPTASPAGTTTELPPARPVSENGSDGARRGKKKSKR
ncbi:MAG: YidC/Oxa1 family insertase periplasmic-domain containing protein [Pirellulales bacterium]|nr:YidC/Oxa1 family insertase periplasmic-domain containing protein [Pirellulales bacterium]